MVRTPYCNQTGVKKGAWTPEEDMKLVAYVTRYGCWNWRQLPKFAGLARCGKSCRLRWLNYLRPDIKRGKYTPQEDETIITLHHKLGNRWSKIAACLPGRTDNDIKNHWHTNLRKRVQENSSVANKKDKSLFKSSKDQTETPFESSQEMSNSSVTAVNTITDPSSQCGTQISSTLQMPSPDNGTFNSDVLISDAFIETMSDNFWTEPYMVDVSNILSEEALLPMTPEYEFDLHLWSYNGLSDEYIGSSY